MKNLALLVRPYLNLIRVSHLILKEEGEAVELPSTSYVVERAILPVGVGLSFTSPPNSAESPSISVTQPTGKLAKQARWAYELSYGMQHSAASRHVLILSGEEPAGEVSFCDGHPPRPLAEDEALQIVADLTSLSEAEL